MSVNPLVRGIAYPNKGIHTKREGSVHLTSSLRWLVL
jgi:hypothetical protein